MSIDVVVGVVGTVAALALSQWPRIAPLLAFPSPKPQPASGVSYAQALEALAVVRARLAAAGQIAVDSEAAIETLTLALVKGSDK